MRRSGGDMDVGSALRRVWSTAADSSGSSPAHLCARPYTHPCFTMLAKQDGPVDESRFQGRACGVRAVPDEVFICPPAQELQHDGRVVAHGLVDASCELISAQELPSRYCAVSLRTLGENAERTPCWAWGDGTLMEAFLGAVSVHTLVWEARMTGYVTLSHR